MVQMTTTSGISELNVNQLRSYSKVLLTGCQRSGTTVITRMLASDLGYRHVDESEFNIYNVDKFQDFMKGPEKMVIHCPTMTYLLHNMCLEGVIIVWVHRPYKEIRASMDRINWSRVHEPIEKEKYLPLSKRYTINLDETIEVIKNHTWTNIQCPILSSKGIPYMNMEYHSNYVKQHPLYVPDPHRKNFASKQTKA